MGFFDKIDNSMTVNLQLFTRMDCEIFFMDILWDIPP